jgi:hypothetical protein
MDDRTLTPTSAAVAHANAKIRRSESHIKDLDLAIRSFFGARPFTLVSQVNEEKTEEVWSIQVDTIPEEIESIFADAVHNLRTPLDKILSTGFRHPLLHMPNAKAHNIKFPFAEDLQQLDRQLALLSAHLSEPVIDFIRRAEPYRGGAGHILWAINKLDNHDKHRALLQPTKLSFTTANFRQIISSNGFMLCLGSRRGKHLVPVAGATPGAWHLEQPVKELQPTLRQAIPSISDYYLEFTSSHDDMEVFTTTPGANVSANLQPNLNIALRHFDGLEGQPILDVLTSMHRAVADTVNAFSADFF